MGPRVRGVVLAAGRGAVAGGGHPAIGEAVRSGRQRKAVIGWRASGKGQQHRGAAGLQGHCSGRRAAARLPWRQQPLQLPIGQRQEQAKGCLVAGVQVAMAGGGRGVHCPAIIPQVQGPHHARILQAQHCCLLGIPQQGPGVAGALGGRLVCGPRGRKRHHQRSKGRGKERAPARDQRGQQLGIVVGSVLRPIAGNVGLALQGRGGRGSKDVK